MKKYFLLIGVILALFLFISVVTAANTSEVNINEVMTLVYNGHINADSIHKESNWYQYYIYLMDVNYKDSDKTYYAFISFIDDKGNVAFENNGIDIHPKKQLDRILVSGGKDDFTNITKVVLVIKDKKYDGNVVFNKTFAFDSSNITTTTPPSADKVFSGNSKFKELDTNHDGKLSIDEFEVLGEYIVEDSFWDDYSFEEAVISEFENLDLNGDGFLSLKEFTRMY